MITLYMHALHKLNNDKKYFFFNFAIKLFFRKILKVDTCIWIIQISVIYFKICIRRIVALKCFIQFHISLASEVLQRTIIIYFFEIIGTLIME